jgi:hypothetical protein
LELTKSRGTSKVSLDVFATALVHDFPTERLSRVGQSISRWRESAAHAVNAFSEYHLNAIQAFRKHDDFKRLAISGRAHRYLLGFHFLFISYGWQEHLQHVASNTD